jgi:hypothetical protein
MASEETEDAAADAAKAVALPEVAVEETADEERFECPQPWFLALLACAMSAMTSITVAGSLFFVLAAPEKVSPHCAEQEHFALRALCTSSTVCFWTYPVVCCLFVVLVFAKNLVDQRIYYEFLLHKVVIGYGRANPLANGVVIALLIYALCAFSALVWYHVSKPRAMVGSVFASLAYITPIISFLAVILTQWSIQGKLITLPNFLQDYAWSVEHLQKSRCYSVEQLHEGYKVLEEALLHSDETLNTPRMIALTESYAKLVPVKATQDVETAETASADANTAAEAEKASPDAPPLSAKDRAVEEAKELGKEAVEALDFVAGKVEDGVVEGVQVVESTEYVYWPWRFLFNPRLQDDRATNFRNWTIGYLISVILAIILGVYVYACCLITCLEIEKVLTPSSAAWAYTHHFSLRPDIQHGPEQSLKQVAANAAMSVINHPTKALFLNRASALTHFQLGAAAM